MGSGSSFGRNTLPLRENEGAENAPDPLVLRDIYVRPVNGYLKRWPISNTDPHNLIKRIRPAIVTRGDASQKDRPFERIWIVRSCGWSVD